MNLGELEAANVGVVREERKINFDVVSCFVEYSRSVVRFLILAIK